jgi:sterol desaturase/sphingolipid hydroxylase (fatty acid hydroxylase superfamily)
MSATSPSAQKGSKGAWHHQGAVVFSPLFDWPLKPVPILLTLTKRWVTLSRNVLFVLLGLCTYLFLLPAMPTMATLSWDWIARIYLINIVLMFGVTGGLHWYFYIYRGQGKRTKFDARDDLDSGKKFTFNEQVLDNMFWSLASGVTVWTAYEVLYFWGAANGVIPTLDFVNHPIAFFVWLFVLPFWIATHFFLIHRLLHWPPLFRSVHRLHHRNIQVGPWSGMSMHPVEHIIFISSVLIHFVIASHPVVFLFQLYHRALVPAFSHSGFDQMIVKGRVVGDAADFHHQLHHRHFECNYGNVDVPLDRWFDCEHDGSDEDTVRVQKRRRDMFKKRG